MNIFLPLEGKISTWVSDSGLLVRWRMHLMPKSCIHSSHTCLRLSVVLSAMDVATVCSQPVIKPIWPLIGLCPIIVLPLIGSLLECNFFPSGGDITQLSPLETGLRRHLSPGQQCPPPTTLNEGGGS